MLWTISVVLITLWVLGVVSNYMMGGFIHLLLVIAIVAVLLRVIKGKKLVYRSGFSGNRVVLK